MQVQILNGVYSDVDADFRTSYPRNMIPVPKAQGISNGYLRPAEGIVAYAGTARGIDQGGINWNGVCYRVMGGYLVSIADGGAITTVGFVGGTNQATLDYSFDYLAIVSNKNLFLYDGSLLKKNTDVDLGDVLDAVWVDGYFMTTDGESLVVTELNDPFAVLTTKYGSSEIDPDPVVAVLKIRNEPHAINRYTIEAFSNVGGTGFPFQRIDGAQIQKGAIGTHACCVYMDRIAFLGGGRNEANSIYLGANSTASPIATREIDQILESYTDSQLSEVVLEERVYNRHVWLYVHLPDQTLVYDHASSLALEVPVWFTLSSSYVGDSQYRARNFVYCYDKWLVGDPETSQTGYMDDSLSSHWGTDVSWEFGTPIIYNASNGAIIHEMELVGLVGRAAHGADPTIWTSYSKDGETWSNERPIRNLTEGNRKKRMTWFQQGNIENWRIQRFRGESSAMVSPSRLELRIESLEH